jgi:methyl-accepting chemotaxis protein
MKKKSKSNNVKKVKFGILQKLIIGFLIPVVFIVVLGFISYRKSSSGLISNYEQATRNSMRMATKYIETGLNSVDAISIGYAGDSELEYYIRGLAKTEAQEKLAYVMAINSELLQKTNLEPFVENIHVIPSNKVTLLSSDIENMSGFYDEMLAEKEGMGFQNKEKEYYWLGEHPLIDSKLKLDSNGYALSLFRRFPSNAGSIVIDISKSEIESFLSDLALGKDSIVGLITPDGKELLFYGSDEKKENQTKQDGTDVKAAISNDIHISSETFFQDTIKTTEASDSKYVEYQSSEYLYLYNKIGDTGITICALVPKASIMKQANDIKNITIFIVLIASVIAVLVGTMIAGGIGSCIRSINKSLNQISEGDLTVNVKVKRKDEFAILAHNISDMIQNMRGLIEKVIHVSGLVSDSAINVMNASNTLYVASDNISSILTEIGHGISGQAEDSQNCLFQMDALSQKITVVNENVNEIEKVTEDTKNMIYEGITTMEELSKQSEATNDITKYVVDNITALETKSHAISNIIQVINDIADQTNLLSLNASIEAARAGEAGKGFAVVADEIRKLADESIKAANQIKVVVEEIAMQTKETAKTAKEAENIVNKQNIIVDTTVTTFENMNQGIEKLLTSLSMIGVNMKNMDGARIGTLNAIESISAIAEETLAGKETVDETVTSQNNSIKTLEEASNVLVENAKELDEAIHIFRLS